MIFGLLPILLLNMIIVLMLGLAAALWFFTSRNRLQKALVGIILLWVVMFFGLEVLLIRVYDGVQTPVSGVMNFHVIWLGLIGLFSLIIYPAMVLHQRYIGLRSSLLWLSPVLLTILVYVIWHLVTGMDMNYRYPTVAQLWEARYTMPVILRTLMIVFFIAYLVLVLGNIWRLIPVYQKYSEENYSDTGHNVAWLRLVVAAIGSICVTYLIVLIWKNPIGEMLYSLVTGAFFIRLSINVFFHKLFTEGEYIEVKWSFRYGWQLADKKPKQGLKTDSSVLHLRLATWIQSEKPYKNPDFAASDVYAVFPELRPPVLKELLANRGLTFQSYVRELRIEEACRIMDAEPHILCKQVAWRVGLSSSQILSRAFVAVKGQTPLEFRKPQTEEN